MPLPFGVVKMAPTTSVAGSAATTTTTPISFTAPIPVFTTAAALAIATATATATTSIKDKDKEKEKEKDRTTITSAQITFVEETILQIRTPFILHETKMATVTGPCPRTGIHWVCTISDDNYNVVAPKACFSIKWNGNWIQSETAIKSCGFPCGIQNIRVVPRVQSERKKEQVDDLGEGLLLSSGEASLSLAGFVVWTRDKEKQAGALQPFMGVPSFDVNLEDLHEDGHLRFDIVLSTSKVDSQQEQQQQHQQEQQKKRQQSLAHRSLKTLVPQNFKIMQALMKDIKTMDVVFTFANGKDEPCNIGVWAHQLVVRQWSSFEAFLDQSMKTGKPKRIEEGGKKGDADMMTVHIPNHSWKAFCCMMRYMYTGEIELEVDPTMFATGPPPASKSNTTDIVHARVTFADVRRQTWTPPHNYNNQRQSHRRRRQVHSYSGTPRTSAILHDEYDPYEFEPEDHFTDEELNEMVRRQNREHDEYEARIGRGYSANHYSDDDSIGGSDGESDSNSSTRSVALPYEIILNKPAVSNWEDLYEVAYAFGLDAMRDYCKGKILSGLVATDNRVMKTLFGVGARHEELEKPILEFVAKHLEEMFERGGGEGGDPFLWYKEHEDCHRLLVEIMRLRLKSGKV